MRSRQIICPNAGSVCDHISAGRIAKCRRGVYAWFTNIGLATKNRYRVSNNLGLRNSDGTVLCHVTKKSMSSLSSNGLICNSNVSIKLTRSGGKKNNIVWSYTEASFFLLGFVHFKQRSNFNKLRKHFFTKSAFLRMVSVAGMSVLLSLDSFLVGLVGVSGIMRTLCF